MTDDCVFCNIINRTIDSEILEETEDYIIIRDILPKAPVHVLIIPKKHIISLNHLEKGDELMVGKLIFAAKNIANKLGVSDSGYKLIFNVGKDGGQVIAHLHLHMMGGKPLPE